MKLVFFGGKGGVGKTTCAASAGLYYSGKNMKTLIISTDPAHSLSDSMGQIIGNSITAIKGVDNLYALEVDAEKVLSTFKIEYEDELRTILDTSTYLDTEDIDSMLQLSMPGMDELMGLKTVVDLMEIEKFSVYIVDTAPTGHALHLLNSPHLIDEWVKVMAKLRWKYRYMVKSFSGTYVSDSSDDFLMMLKKTVKKIERLLRDNEQSEFIVVTKPEPMVILETERLVHNLIEFGIPIKRIIINNVALSEGCQFCRDRIKSQKKYIDIIFEKFKHHQIIKVPLQAQPVSGISSLEKVKNILFNKVL